MTTETQGLDEQIGVLLFAWTERLCDGRWQLLTIAGKRVWACLHCASQLPDGKETPPVPHRVNLAGVPPYSSDIAEAFRIVDAMRERGWTEFMLTHRDIWVASFLRLTVPDSPRLGRTAHSAEAPEPAEAIVRAALAALDAERADKPGSRPEEER